MSALLLALLTAAPATAEQAKSLAAAKSWEDLYLAFSAADPKGYPPKDRTAIGQALESGCAAIALTDAVMGYSLGERAVAFHPTAPALLCLARAGKATEQREAAEQALRRGLKEFPKDGAFPLELGKQLLEDKDAAGAQAVLKRVPKRSPQYAEAQALLSKAKDAASQETAARKEATAIETRIAKGDPDKSRGTVAAKGSKSSLSYESGEGPDGMRTRGNSRFLFKYFAHNRDFGQRADYEGRVVDAMNEVYDYDKEVLGLAREAPCDVILYTREEFGAHFSQAAAYRVAGLYFMNAIRMNDSEEITHNTKAILVHEYVHAIVDDVVHGHDSRLPHWLNEGLAEYVEWRYLGSGDPPLRTQQMMHAAALANRLPSLQQMDRGAPINEGNPMVSYGVSAIAVKQLVNQGGMDALWGLIREVGAGTPFEKSLQDRYGKTTGKLQEEVRDELAHL